MAKVLRGAGSRNRSAARYAERAHSRASGADLAACGFAERIRRSIAECSITRRVDREVLPSITFHRFGSSMGEQCRI